MGWAAEYTRAISTCSCLSCAVACCSAQNLAPTEAARYRLLKSKAQLQARIVAGTGPRIKPMIVAISKGTV